MQRLSALMTPLSQDQGPGAAPWGPPPTLTPFPGPECLRDVLPQHAGQALCHARYKVCPFSIAGRGRGLGLSLTAARGADRGLSCARGERPGAAPRNVRSGVTDTRDVGAGTPSDAQHRLLQKHAGASAAGGGRGGGGEDTF